MRYESSLSDCQWDLIRNHFDTGNYGKGRRHSRRELLDAVLYVVKTGCHWYLLPKDFPPYKTVYSFYKRAKDKGIWEKMMQDLVEKDRIKMNRKAKPTYGIIDSQSVKTANKAMDRGIDGGEKN